MITGDESSLVKLETKENVRVGRKTVQTVQVVLVRSGGVYHIYMTCMISNDPLCFVIPTDDNTNDILLVPIMGGGSTDHRVRRE